MAAELFTDDSMLRRVIREQVVGLSGPRALLMQATHPVAWAGFFAHTGAMDEPYERLARTAQVMDLIAFGDKAKAQKATRRVRAMHARVRGELAEPVGRWPAGTPYAADDPVLLLWILATLVDSAVIVYERYVARLSRAEKEALWTDYKVVGREFGLHRRADARRLARLPRLHGRHARRRRPARHATTRASWRSRSSCTRRCR